MSVLRRRLTRIRGTEVMFKEVWYFNVAFRVLCVIVASADISCAAVARIKATEAFRHKFFVKCPHLVP